MSYYRDLRDYLAALEKAGKLVRIKNPINKDTQLHPLARLQFRGLPEEERKAFLFEKVTDSRGKTYRGSVALGVLAASRQIYALGMMCRPEEISPKWQQAQMNPIKPRMVAKGPVQEEVHAGKNLMEHGGLDEFPIPISTPGYEVAPYFTAPYWVTRDPDTGVRNVGTYRAQLKSPTRTGMWPSKLDQHINIHLEKCRKKGRNLEAAVIIGGAPNIGYVSVSRVPTGVDEYEVAGGLAGEPVELVKCRTVDLEVPAHAEIVIEGMVDTTHVEPESPFGEAMGYLGPRDLTYFFNVTGITHRKNPIWQTFLSQIPPSESSVLKLAWEYNTLAYLRYTLKMDFVLDVANHASSLTQRLMVVKLKRTTPENVQKALKATADYLPAQGKIVVAVDEDIDPRDADMLNWAIAYRSQPHRDFKIETLPAADLMDPSLAPPWEMEKFTLGKNMPTSSRVLIDATMKWDYPPISLPKKEYMEEALKLWQENGLPPLKLKEPWWGTNLGYWSEEEEAQAQLAVKGKYYRTGEEQEKQRKPVS
ncbi:MAG: UbiD family decarboxylase [Chloroflexota bacterium]